MEISCPINIDKFDGDYCCWMEVTNVPETFIKQAKEIDGENYEPSCFGICVTKATDGGEFWNVTTENPIGQLFYIDINGEKNWMAYKLSEEEEQKAIEFCKNYIKENKM
jgi:hypothetical protein